MLRTLVWRGSAAEGGPAEGGPAEGGPAEGSPAEGSPAATKLMETAAAGEPDTAAAGAAQAKNGRMALCYELDDPTDISALLAKPGTFLWLDLTAPSPDELRLIAEEFSLHPLAVEDAAEHSQRPKIEQYDNFYLMVVFAITAVDPNDPDEAASASPPPGHLAGARVRLHEIDLFIGERYLITVHDSQLPLLDQMAEHWRQNRREFGDGIGAQVYALLDGIVDAYFPILDGIVDRIEALEEALFTAGGQGGVGVRPEDVRDLFQIKKDLLQMRRVIAPERDALLVLTRQEAHLFDRRITLYFQDVYDHVVRLTDTIDVYQDLLTNALDSNLAIVSNNLNQVMKTLTALTVILMAPTLIAGIYGMNFKLMPEIDWAFGYPMALGMMGTTAGLLFLYFRRKGWI
jgi:magnesium transporter